MPAPNDLTPEEEAEFAQHGVPSAGQGREPLADENAQGGQQQPSAEQQGQQQEPPQQGQQQPRDDRGRFAASQPGQQPSAEQQGQQQQPGEGEQPGEQGEQRTVPLPALQQERAARQAAARRAQLAETRLNAILARQAESPQQQREAMPNINEDPAGYILALEERLQRFEQERTETVQYQQIDNAINTDEETFTHIQPDYPQASDYFVQSRAKELLAFYPPQEAQRIMLSEARQIARQAWERGQSAAEVVYGLAQARGYNPNAPQREPVPQQQGQGGQQQGGQQPQGQGGPSAAAVIDSVARGQQASRSLSTGSGATAESLNAAAILDMDDAEFARWLGEGGDATKRFATIG